MMRSFAGAVVLLVFATLAALGQDHDRLNLVLPTDNGALFSGDGPAFYQYIERDYKGEMSNPWEGGQYGFVRDPIETSAGMVYRRFHEGIDIRCIHRDAHGEPLDEVRAIADGRVVHTNPVVGHSNYGKYVVIEHRWNGCSYYSLYAHLSAISVQPGEEVQGGEQIAAMGHTGQGLNQARAHVHLELNLMLSRHFQDWYDAFFKNDPNYNGIYNGFNLAGLDIARLYLALRENPALTIPEFLASEEVFYKVTFPRSASFDLPKMYPWMLASRAGPETASWEVSFARSGLPLKIESSQKSVTEPELTYIEENAINYSYLTERRISGHGKNAHLTESGKRLMRLLIYPD